LSKTLINYFRGAILFGRLFEKGFKMSRNEKNTNKKITVEKDKELSIFDEITEADTADKVERSISLVHNGEMVEGDTKLPFYNRFFANRFSDKDKGKLSKVLSHLSFYGLQRLKVQHYLTLAKVMVKYKLKYPDLVDLYNEHCAAWGGLAKTYTFKAYKNEKMFKQVNLGPSLSFDLKVKVLKEELENKETYDVTRISIAYVDQYNNVMPYANKPVVINIEGPIELLGPSIESLLGGQLSIYVRSKNEVGEAKVTIICEDIVKEIQLKVK
jgi:hypothetical protein